MPQGFGVNDLAYLNQGSVAGKGAPQYVLGTPAQKPVLRPLRQNLHDAERYAAGAGAFTRRELFINRSRFQDGTAKDESHTNMPSDGQLGTPLEFDLIGFQGFLSWGIDILNFFPFYNLGVFKWVFGQQTVWLNVKLTEIPQGIGPFGQTTENLTSILAAGWGTVNNFYNFTNHKRQARKIFSNESFRNVIEHPAGFTPDVDVDEDVYWWTVMVGMLYASL
jgi:hypothetical protein